MRKAVPVSNNDAAFAKYLKKLDKYGEKEEDECEFICTHTPVSSALPKNDSRDKEVCCRVLTAVGICR